MEKGSKETEPAWWPGDFKFVRLIGSGRHSTAYAARTSDGRDCIVKYFDDSPTFENEDAARDIPQSRYLVQRIDFKRPMIIVLARAEGSSLYHKLPKPGTSSTEKAPTDEEVFRVARGLLKGLQALQRNGIIARDLSPKNVFVSNDWTPQIVRYRDAVVDGKAAKLNERSKYIRAGDTTVGAALYSLGATLFELIDKPAFDAWAAQRPTGLDRSQPLRAFVDDLISGTFFSFEDAIQRLPAGTPEIVDEPSASTAGKGRPNSGSASWAVGILTILNIVLALCSWLQVFAEKPADVRREDPPRRGSDAQSPKDAPTNQTVWVDRENPTLCIGYQVAKLSEEQIPKAWACNEYVAAKDFSTPLDELFKQNESARKKAIDSGRQIFRPVWIAPLMSEPGAERTLATSAALATQIQELWGLIELQTRLNEAESGPLVQIVVANAGPELKFGQQIAKRIAEWRSVAARAAPVAAIGFIESYVGTRDTIDTLDSNGITSLGTIAAAKFAPKFKRYIAVRTGVAVEAAAMVAEATRGLGAKTNNLKIWVVYGADPNLRPLMKDIYKTDLGEEVEERLETFAESAPNIKLVVAPKSSADASKLVDAPAKINLEQFCKSHDRLLYLGRNSELESFLKALAQACGAESKDVPPPEVMGRIIANYSVARLFEGGRGDLRKLHLLRFVKNGRNLLCSEVELKQPELCDHGYISIYAMSGARALNLLVDAVGSMYTRSETPSVTTPPQEVQQEDSLYQVIDPRELNARISEQSLTKEHESPSPTSPRNTVPVTVCTKKTLAKWDKPGDPFTAPRVHRVASSSDSGGQAGLEVHDQDLWIVQYLQAPGQKPSDPVPRAHCIQRLTKPQNSASPALMLSTQLDCCLAEP